MIKIILLLFGFLMSILFGDDLANALNLNQQGTVAVNGILIVFPVLIYLILSIIFKHKKIRRSKSE